MAETCETCRWWNPASTGSYGTRYDAESKQIWAHYCQRRPEFVARYFDDWCGERVPHPETKP